MKYKDFEIRGTTHLIPTSSTPKSTCGIYRGDKLMSYVESAALAKRAIDAHTQAGIWKAKEDEENGEGQAQVCRPAGAEADRKRARTANRAKRNHA